MVVRKVEAQKIQEEEFKKEYSRKRGSVSNQKSPTPQSSSPLSKLGSFFSRAKPASASTAAKSVSTSSVARGPPPPVSRGPPPPPVSSGPPPPLPVASGGSAYPGGRGAT